MSQQRAELLVSEAWEGKRKLSDPEVAQALHACGISPDEMARLQREVRQPRGKSVRTVSIASGGMTGWRR